MSQRLRKRKRANTNTEDGEFSVHCDAISLLSPVCTEIVSELDENVVGLEEEGIYYSVTFDSSQFSNIVLESDWEGDEQEPIQSAGEDEISTEYNGEASSKSNCLLFLCLHFTKYSSRDLQFQKEQKMYILFFAVLPTLILLILLAAKVILDFSKMSEYEVFQDVTIL